MYLINLRHIELYFSYISHISVKNNTLFFYQFLKTDEVCVKSTSFVFWHYTVLKTVKNDLRSKIPQLKASRLKISI